MKNMNMMTMCDFYKISHRAMYPKGTEIVYSTWTPRGSRLDGISKVVCFGIQSFIKDKLIDMFKEEFFERKKSDIVAEYRRLIKHTLGDQNPETSHIEELHDLGYLPLSIRALPEGTLVPLRVPMLTIHNTDHRFFWLTNYIETLASCELWQPATSATIANEYSFDRTSSSLTQPCANCVRRPGSLRAIWNSCFRLVVHTAIQEVRWSPLPTLHY
jgi:nicotinamide phosphoribosyltransferase